jgi:hypothetical protein
VSADTPDAPAGYRDRVASMLRIDFTDGLAPSSWGAIKRLIR